MRSFQYRQLARQVQQQTVALELQQLRPRDFSQRCTAVLISGSLGSAAVSFDARY